MIGMKSKMANARNNVNDVIMKAIFESAFKNGTIASRNAFMMLMETELYPLFQQKNYDGIEEKNIALLERLVHEYTAVLLERRVYNELVQAFELKTKGA